MPQRNLKSPETLQRAEMMEAGGAANGGPGNSDGGTGEPKRKRGCPSNASKRLLATIAEQPENLSGDGGEVAALELDDDSTELQSLGMD